MGLDTSHDCWHGAYSSFNRWRKKLAEVAGLPPLEMMDGFWESPHSERLLECSLPIPWECLKPDVLHVLLNHSDCDGEIEWTVCADLAARLEELVPLLPDEDAGGHIGFWKVKTQDFIDGLKLAFEQQENVDFH